MLFASHEGFYQNWKSVNYENDFFREQTILSNAG